MGYSASTIREVQEKILTIMKYIDSLCRRHRITYYIMGGTALGAVRHGGFIPWDDDLDLFMTPDAYARFKAAMQDDGNALYVLQEWKTVDTYVEYAKVRMNGTTFIEENFKHWRQFHQGIYVDIMLLHKVPECRFVQRMVYYESKFVTLYALSQRNWKPKTALQSVLLRLLPFLPCQSLAKLAYKHIYHYDNRQHHFAYAYWITPASFRAGLFEARLFEQAVDIPFEDTQLLAPVGIREYLTARYGDYMKLPSEEQRRATLHAMLVDTNKDYTTYIQ